MAGVSNLGLFVRRFQRETRAPHFAQNSSSARRLSPQDAHSRGLSRVPHFRQNTSSSLSGALQVGQASSSAITAAGTGPGLAAGISTVLPSEARLERRAIVSAPS